MSGLERGRNPYSTDNQKHSDSASWSRSGSSEKMNPEQRKWEESLAKSKKEGFNKANESFDSKIGTLQNDFKRTLKSMSEAMFAAEKCSQPEQTEEDRVFWTQVYNKRCNTNNKGHIHNYQGLRSNLAREIETHNQKVNTNNEALERKFPSSHEKYQATPYDLAKLPPKLDNLPSLADAVGKQIWTNYKRLMEKHSIESETPEKIENRIRLMTQYYQQKAKDTRDGVRDDS